MWQSGKMARIPPKKGKYEDIFIKCSLFQKNFVSLQSNISPYNND